jgi:outer membrane protein OmpA-like peptidoglycan-associated protein
MARTLRLWGVAVALTLGFPALASAQGFPLQRYRASEVPEDGFAVSRPIDRGHDRWGAHAHLVYSLNPLVYESSFGDAGTEVGAIVENQVTLDAGLSWGLFDRLIVYAGFPVHLLMTGEARGDAAAPDDATLGDPWLGARVRLFGENDEAVSVAAQATLTLPLADGVLEGQAYSGETTVSFVPELLAEIRPGPVRITANLGLRLRDEHEAAGRVRVPNELTWGLAAAVRLFESDGTLDGIIEAVGSHGLDYFGRRETLSVEVLAGLEYFAKSGFNAGLAGGSGLSRGIGTPDLRVVLSLGYVEPVAGAEPEPPPPADRDEDGIADDVDRCADEPEDLDDYEDEDGCPDLDDDGDGVPDSADECVEEAEDVDGIADEDGCPETDADGDGVADDTDRCPLEAEDADEFQDADGCPDPDNDQDGVPDAEDACPTAPGAAEAEGCPRAVRLDLESGQIRIIERIEFETNRATLQAGAEAILEEVRAVLEVNPQIERVRVEGHTDDRGPDRRNLRLSQGRAGTVLFWLRDHGIAAERLEGWGCGETRPLEEGTTEEARQANRRVEFHIIDVPAESTEAPVEEETSEPEGAEAPAQPTESCVPVATPGAGGG